MTNHATRLAEAGLINLNNAQPLDQLRRRDGVIVFYACCDKSIKGVHNVAAAGENHLRSYFADGRLRDAVLNTQRPYFSHYFDNLNIVENITERTWRNTPAFLAAPTAPVEPKLSATEVRHGFPCSHCGAKTFEEAGNLCSAPPGWCPGTDMSSEVFAKPADAGTVGGDHGVGPVITKAIQQVMEQRDAAVARAEDAERYKRSADKELHDAREFAAHVGKRAGQAEAERDKLRAGCEAMTADITNRMNRENVQERCIDWLKEDVKKLLEERDRLKAELARVTADCLRDVAQAAERREVVVARPVVPDDIRKRLHDDAVWADASNQWERAIVAAGGKIA